VVAAIILVGPLAKDRRLLEPISNARPAELALAYYRQQDEWVLAA